MRLLIGLCLLAINVQADWRLALPGWNYQFPKDHENHPEFKTEWWYFTGNLSSADGRRFGYQLTFFRQGVLLPGFRHHSSLAFRHQQREVCPLCGQRPLNGRLPFFPKAISGRLRRGGICETTTSGLDR